MTQSIDLSLDWTPPPIPDPPVTWEEFLDWCDEDVRAEWIDGRIEVASPANLRHQRVNGLLYLIFTTVASRLRAGVVVGPFLMRLPEPVRRGREPDLIFVANEHLDRLRPTYLDGPADIVVEIVSPDSQARDRGDKFIEYEAAGVPEYWLVDPIRSRVSVFGRDAAGRYVTLFEGGEGVCASRVLPGLRLRVEWLWSEEPLDVDRLLRAIDEV